MKVVTSGLKFRKLAGCNNGLACTVVAMNFCKVRVVSSTLIQSICTQERQKIKTKFEVNQEVEIIAKPGHTGTVVMIDVYGKKYLLDCHPGALSNYTWYKVPEGMLSYVSGGILAGNWFHEEELREITVENI